MARDPSKSLYVLDECRARFDETARALWDCTDRVEDDETDKVPLRDDEREVIAPLVDDGFEVIGTGLARVVLAAPTGSGLAGHVIKLGRYGDKPLAIGMWQNRNEVDFWKSVAHRGDELPLVPVADWLATSYRWLIMPRVVPLADSDDRDAEDAIDTVREGLSEFDCLHDTELDGPNIAFDRDGNPCLLDYGRMVGGPW